MRLYLLRHSLAVPHGTPGYRDDSLRPLTEQGHAQARAVARGFKRLGKPVDVILTSPYVRARQTADHMAEVLGRGVVVKEWPVLKAEVEPSSTSQGLKAFVSQEHLMLVGHEPHLSLWLGQLVAGAGGFRCVFKKAGMACVELTRVPPPAGSGALRWLLTPRQLALIGAPAKR